MSDERRRDVEAPDVIVIEHKLPTSAEMRAAINERVKRGLPLGALHNGIRT